ncbi:MAG: hypothetical protein HY550_02905 [Elusimicrobia bacterium]|nr:hypothetical protein [Elusimicrobiota bacterium]
MKRLILAAIAAAIFSAAVSARESAPGSARASGRDIRKERIIIENAGRDRLALETLERLTPGADPGAAQVTFAVRSLGDPFSPADGSALEDMATWQLQILDSSGKKAGFIQGKGQTLPPMLGWSGLSAGGEPFPGGFYTARFVWTDSAKKVYSTREVSFNLFSRLKMPKFAELKLDFRFAGGTPRL